MVKLRCSIHFHRFLPGFISRYLVQISEFLHKVILRSFPPSNFVLRLRQELARRKRQALRFGLVAKKKEKHPPNMSKNGNMVDGCIKVSLYVIVFQFFVARDGTMIWWSYLASDWERIDVVFFHVRRISQNRPIINGGCRFNSFFCWGFLKLGTLVDPMVNEVDVPFGKCS